MSIEICTRKSTYHSFEEITQSEYLDVYSINISPKLLQDNSLVLKLKNFVNTECIYFTAGKTEEEKYKECLSRSVTTYYFPNEFACMQKLSNIGGKICTDNKEYIYEENMIVFLPDSSTNVLPKIPPLHKIF